MVARSRADSHLRLAVLLAVHAAPPSAYRDLVLSPATPWEKRCRALMDALQSEMASRVVLVDLDAAWTAPPSGGRDL